MASRQAKAALFDALASVAQALGSGRRAEIVDVLAQGERSAEELAHRLERGDVVVLDVRPEAEWRAGHIAGARSVPLPELEAVATRLPKRREVVAYCRGPYCVYA